MIILTPYLGNMPQPPKLTPELAGELEFLKEYNQNTAMLVFPDRSFYIVSLRQEGSHPHEPITEYLPDIYEKLGMPDVFTNSAGGHNNEDIFYSLHASPFENSKVQDRKHLLKMKQEGALQPLDPEMKERMLSIALMVADPAHIFELGKPTGQNYDYVNFAVHGLFAETENRLLESLAQVKAKKVKKPE